MLKYLSKIWILQTRLYLEGLITDCFAPNGKRQEKWERKGRGRERGKGTEGEDVEGEGVLLVLLVLVQIHPNRSAYLYIDATYPDLWWWQTGAAGPFLSTWTTKTLSSWPELSKIFWVLAFPNCTAWNLYYSYHRIKNLRGKEWGQGSGRKTILRIFQIVCFFTPLSPRLSTEDWFESKYFKALSILVCPYTLTTEEKWRNDPYFIVGPWN